MLYCASTFLYLFRWKNVVLFTYLLLWHYMLSSLLSLWLLPLLLWKHVCNIFFERIKYAIKSYLSMFYCKQSSSMLLNFIPIPIFIFIQYQIISFEWLYLCYINSPLYHSPPFFPLPCISYQCNFSIMFPFSWTGLSQSCVGQMVCL